MKNSLLAIEKIKNVVNQSGGYREKHIFNNPCIIEKDMWTKAHKVYHVYELTLDKDGHRDGFLVDVVTNTICG